MAASKDELKAYLDEINNKSDAIEAKPVKRVTASETTVLSKLEALVLIVTIVVLALTMICVAIYPKDLFLVQSAVLSDLFLVSCLPMRSA